MYCMKYEHDLSQNLSNKLILQADVEIPGKDFSELIAFCADKCRTPSTNLSGAFRSRLRTLIIHFDQVQPLCLILRLYACGFYYVDCSLNSRDDDLTSSGDVIRMLLDYGGRPTELSDCLSSLESYFLTGSDDVSKRGLFTSHLQKKLKDYLLPYYDALEFLCQPLVDIVYKKQIIADNGASHVFDGLLVIQDAFHHLCDVFLSLQTITCDIGESKQKHIHRASVAAFILSTRTKRNTLRSAEILHNVITSKWIQLDGLKHIYASLYKFLHNNKELTEASEVLKMSCKASWACVIRLCELFA